ncbi:PKD domain-containing protein [Corallococcus terminator]
MPINKHSRGTMRQIRASRSRLVLDFQLPKLIPCLILLLAACGPQSTLGEADVGVSVQSLSASDVAKVTLTVSASDISPSIVQDLQQAGGTFRGIIGSIPTGTQRTFLAQAFDASNTLIYEGHASDVTVTAGETASVVLVLQQSTAPTPYLNNVPRLTGLSTSVSHVKPGQPVALTVTATDADGHPLAYAWTATGGTFTQATTASPTWNAPLTEGTYTLSVSVTDGQGGQTGISLKIAVVSTRGSASTSVSFNAWPVVSQVTGTPLGQVAPGAAVNLDVSAVEPDGDALTYGWADDCGGGFSNPAVKNPAWTAPASAPTGGVCQVTVTVSDGRGGSTTGRLGIGVGLPPIPNAAPVVDHTFQSHSVIPSGGTVTLSVNAHDPEGTALTFTWSASTGALSTPVNSASRSEVVWTAPAPGNPIPITLVVQDADGQKTTHSFTVGFPDQLCVKTVTSYLKKANPYGAPLSVAYAMAGGAGGGANNQYMGLGGARVSGTFTLGAGDLEVFVGGGGGGGDNFHGRAGAGGAGYYGGGGGGLMGGGAGSGGGGGSSAILSGGQIINVAAGGVGGGLGNAGQGGSRTGGAAGTNNYNINPTAGTFGAGGQNSMSKGGTGLNGGAGTTAGGGGGYGGGGGSGASPGGSAGGNGGGTPDTMGLGANTWASATTLPDEAGEKRQQGGNAGLVILTYSAPTCEL